MGQVFNFGPSSNPAAAVSSCAPSVGMSWLFSWSQVEPSRGNYDFSAIDAALSAAAAGGKVSMLRVKGGQESPTWAVKAFPSVSFLLNPGGPQGNQQITLPIPWDSGYLAAFCEWIAAFGARYDGDKRIAVVQMPGCGRIGEMDLGAWSGWTSTAAPPNGCGPEPYTDARDVAAWTQVIKAYAAAFPTTTLAMDLGKPISASVTAESDVAGVCLGLAPKVIALQNNGFRASSTSYFVTQYAGKAPIGAQTWGSAAQMNETVQQILNTATQEQLSYIELYRADCGTANDALFSAYAKATPSLPTPGPHRRVGLPTRRLTVERRVGARRAGAADRRAAFEAGAGNRRLVARRLGARRIGAADRRQDPSRP